MLLGSVRTAAYFGKIEKAPNKKLVWVEKRLRGKELRENGCGSIHGLLLAS